MKDWSWIVDPECYAQAALPPLGKPKAKIMNTNTIAITFTIDLDGNISSDVENGNGLNCLEATRPYEDALGDANPDRQMKPEGSCFNAIATTIDTQITL